MRKKFYLLVAAIAVFFVFPFFGIVAYAMDNAMPGSARAEAIARMEDIGNEAQIIEEQPSLVPITEYPGNMDRPLTPPGTGTVIDYATDADEKLFYTITTADEHIFYLGIQI